MTIWPSVEEEHAQSLARRGQPVALSWKSNGPLLAVVFFFMTSLAAAAFAALFGGVHLIVAMVCIGVAEGLIQGKRYFGTGIESALWTAGLVTLILTLPRSGRVEALLVFALAAAVVGLRMRSPLFGTLAAILVVAYAAAKWKTPLPPMVAGAAIGAVAMIALRREWRRESNEQLFAWMAVALPGAGYIASLIVTFGRSRWWIAAAYALFGAAAMLAAIRLRHRAMLIASFVPIAIAGFEMRDRVAASAEVQGIVAGLLLMAIARVVAFSLRDRTAGWVVTPSKMTPYDEAIQVLGAVAVTPHSGPPQEGGPQIESGGSSFGGAGAGGGY